MKEKENNKKSSISEFQRYVRGELTKREENAFRGKLHNDPFAEGPIESFSEISPQEAADDMDPPGKQFKKRIKSRKRIIFYTTAASVAVLIIISSLFIILDRNKPARQLSKNIIKPVPLEVTDSNQITELLLAESKNALDTAPSAGIENPAIAKNTEALAMTGGKDSNLYIAKDQISVPAAEFRKQEIPDLNVRGKILSSENNLPIAGVKVLVKGTNTGSITDTGGIFKITFPDETNRTLVTDFAGMESKEFQAISGTEMRIVINPPVVALNEVVFTKYESVKKAENVQTGYISPQPVAGNSNFNKYIKDNIIRPLAQPQGEEAVAVVSFVVRTTGTIDSIKVISSPGNEFAREAIRLIREGPAWKPAEDNGRTIDDEVRVRIVWKSQWPRP